MLGGAGGKIACQEIDQCPPGLGEMGDTGHHISGLEQPWYFHGDNAVSTGQGMAVAHSGGYGLVDGPVSTDQIFYVGKPLVQYLGAVGVPGYPSTAWIPALTHSTVKEMLP